MIVFLIVFSAHHTVSYFISLIIIFLFYHFALNLFLEEVLSLPKNQLVCLFIFNVFWYYLTSSMNTQGQVASVSARLCPPYLYLNLAKGLSMYSSTKLYGFPLPWWIWILASWGRPACDGTSDFRKNSCQVGWSTWLTYMSCYLLG